jgi:hypothetical protein
MKSILRFMASCLLAFVLPASIFAQTSTTFCFQSQTNPNVGAKITVTFNAANQTYTIRATLSKGFVDNTYGTNAIGWPNGHKFGDLVGSDQLQLALSDASGVKRMEFKMDYISTTSTSPTGYRTLGVTGGDGKMLVGSAADVLNVETSLSKNFNTFGYVLTTNSPATDANYTPNPQFPNWIYDVWYEATVRASAFPGGLGSVAITGVHASPSKTGNNTEIVIPVPCPCNIQVNGTVNNVNCKGGNTGSIVLTVTGNTGNVTYQWSNGATTQNLTGLAAGTYTVTVTDNGTANCTATKTFTITEPSAISVIGVTSNVTQTGANNGSITLTVTGGTPPYTFQWSNGAMTQNLTGLAAGTYTVTVTDARGCPVMKTFTIGGPSCNLALAATIQDVTCFGGSNGVISVGVSGGSGSYSFLWNDGATTQGRTGLKAGSYVLTVTDNVTGCKITTPTFIINQPAPITVTSVVGNTSGGLNNGSITLTVSGGTPPYSFFWNDGATSQNRTGLAPGTYTVNITDRFGCPATKTFTIGTTTCNLVINSTELHISCFGGNNGTITLNVTGGVGPFAYQWSNGATTQTLTGLTAGNYTVNVTDLGTGCTASRSFTLFQPNSALNVNGVTVNASNGFNNGSITLTVSGGTPPYTFFWNDGVTTQNRSGLAPGTYTVTVKDANGCLATKTFTIGTTTTCNLVVNGTSQNVNCFGGATGSITITSITGAVGALSFFWNDGVTTLNRSGLPAGTYTLTVTDLTTQCQATRSFTISQPASPLNVSGSVVNASGGFNNGSITLTVTGGTSPYSFMWNDGVTTQNRTGLAPGTYTVTVIDARGCPVVKTFTISTTTCNLIVAATVNHISCFGGNNGSISLSVAGGSGAYSFQWNDGSTLQNRSGLIAGNYSVNITDLNTGCTTSRSFTLFQPASALTMTGVTINASGGLNNGSIDVTVTGGTPPYTYMWNDGATTEDRTGLAPGTYTVTVTDANGCKASKTFTIGTTTTCNLVVNAVVTNTSCYGGSDGSIILTVTGAQGPVSFLWNDGSTSQNRTGLKVGWYQVTVTDLVTNCKVVKSFNVGQPLPLNYKATVTDVSVAGASDGSIISYISGGTPPYTFIWNDGSTSLNRFNLPVGAYTITIFDSKGCTIAFCVFVRVKGQCNLLTVTGTVTSTCGCNTSDGTITLSVSGGTGPYTFKWSDGPTTQNRTGLAAGTYTVTVTDAVGCSKTVSFTVTTAIVVSGTTVNLGDRPATASFGQTLSASVSPNPTTTGQVKLVVNSQVNTTAVVNVMDMSGRKMMGTTFSLTRGINYKELNLSSHASGMYTIELLTNGDRKVLKVAVQK